MPGTWYECKLKLSVFPVNKKRTRSRLQFIKVKYSSLITPRTEVPTTTSRSKKRKMTGHWNHQHFYDGSITFTKQKDM